MPVLSERRRHCREAPTTTVLQLRLYQGFPFSQSHFRLYPESARALPETPHCSPKFDIRKTTTWYATEGGVELLVHDRTERARSSGTKPSSSPAHFAQDAPLEIQGHNISKSRRSGSNSELRAKASDSYATRPCRMRGRVGARRRAKQKTCRMRGRVGARSCAKQKTCRMRGRVGARSRAKQKPRRVERARASERAK